MRTRVERGLPGRMLALALLAGRLGCSAASDRPPDSAWAAGMNLVLVTLDTTRADHLSCLGGPAGLTPRLDELAAQSAVFTRAWSETNNTNPSHITMLTGLRAIDHGVDGNFERMSPELDSLPLALKRAGYRTAAVLSARHLSDVGWRGFDYAPPVPRRGLSARATTDRAIQALQALDPGPFFLWVHYFEPHMLYQPPDEIAKAFYPGDPRAGSAPELSEGPYFSRPKIPKPMVTWLEGVRDPKYPTQMYAGEVHYTDREVGRLLDFLRERALSEGTVVAVVADHGESLGEHGIYYDHIGLYEQQLRIPFIVHVPGMKPLRSALPVSTLDLTPTLAELLGVEVREQAVGASLVGTLRGLDDVDAPQRGPLVHQHARNSSVALRDGEWKLIWTINRLAGRGPQLFHLGDDPAEEHNLAEREPERVARMRETLDTWIARGMSPPRGRQLDEEARKRLRALGYAE